MTVIEDVVAPVLHKNDIPPAAVNVAEPPAQNAAFEGVIIQVGAGLTKTAIEQDAVFCEASVTVTVYVVVTVGATKIVAVVSPVLQRNDIPPEAVSTLVSPGQIAAEPQIMLHGGPVCAAELFTEPNEAMQKINNAIRLNNFFAGVFRHVYGSVSCVNS